jgi:hypothetical protein
MAKIINLAAYKRRWGRDRQRVAQQRADTFMAASAAAIEALLVECVERMDGLLDAASALPEGSEEQWAVELEIEKWCDLSCLLNGLDPIELKREARLNFDNS